MYCIIVTYAILKHKLLDIEVIVKKTLVFAGLSVFVFGILISSMLIVQQLIFRGAAIEKRLLGIILSGIIIILTMRRIEDFLINITDKYLFQKKYDYKELLRTFTEEVLTVLDLDRLVRLTVDKLIHIVRISSCAVVLRDRERDGFRLAASGGVEDSGAPYCASVEAVKDSLHAELAIPMTLHGKTIGVLALGKKKSDKSYAQDDLAILEPLARTLAIAISNAELFEELGKTQAEAAQREKMAVIGTLAAGMAHEIRNPITTIKIFSEFLNEKKGDPAFIKKFSELVPKEVEKINHMITHLLEFSKPADFRSMAPVHIKDALDDVLDILENEMALNDIVLEEGVGNVPLVLGNRKYLQEIIFNLVQNAIGAIGRRGKITIKAQDMGRCVRLTIKDTGCGIPAENLKHIFEPFFTTKLNEKGVGLGLYVIKQLMGRMNGAISVESRPGEGAAFSLDLEKADA